MRLNTSVTAGLKARRGRKTSIFPSFDELQQTMVAKHWKHYHRSTRISPNPRFRHFGPPRHTNVHSRQTKRSRDSPLELYVSRQKSETPPRFQACRSPWREDL